MHDPEIERRAEQYTCSTMIEKNSQINNTITKHFKGQSRIQSFLDNVFKWIINFITKTDKMVLVFGVNKTA